MEINQEAEKWKARFERERLAKKEAERLLEEKSLELYLAQQVVEAKLQELDTAFQEVKLSNEMLASTEEELQQNIEELSAANEDRLEALRQTEKLNADLEVTVGLRTAELQSEKTKILSSINYAKRIQDAILPDEAYLRAYLPDSFILSMPRDIVSGDFPFVYKKEGMLVLAAADCTGHGVPGAMMSFVGYQALNDAVKSPFLQHPDLFLNYVDLYVNQLLKQNSSNNKDGMDLALCILDLAAGQLLFAGANNPLLLIKNGIPHFVKGSAQHIGGINDGAAKKYEAHRLPLDPGASYYVFSDGFQDQFGGPENRKFMIRQLRGLITEIAGMPMNEQKKFLLEKFLQWKGGGKQIDDVLIMGFRWHLA